MTTLDQLSEVECLVNVMRCLLRELGKSLAKVRVEGPRVNHQPSFNNVFTKLVLMNHALDCSVEHLLRLFLKHVPHRRLLHVTDPAGVLSVHFIFFLSPSHVLVCRVYDHTVVTKLSRSNGLVSRFVLPSEVVSTQYCDTTQRHAGSIEQVPGLALVLDGTVHRLRVYIGLFVHK